jgi:hypothetical protein
VEGWRGEGAARWWQHDTECPTACLSATHASHLVSVCGTIALTLVRHPKTWCSIVSNRTYRHLNVGSWARDFAVSSLSRRMVSYGMLRHVALVRTDVSEQLRASFIRVTRILRSVRRLLVRASIVLSSPILVNLMKEALSFSETSVLTRATRRNIQEDAILHSHRRENFKSYMYNAIWPIIKHLWCNEWMFRVTKATVNYRSPLPHYNRW